MTTFSPFDTAALYHYIVALPVPRFNKFKLDFIVRPGITGQLFSQFAATIAISVLISAFNALTLSPALAAMILKPKKAGRGPLTKFYGWFNRVFGTATNSYVRVCGAAIRKLAISLLLLVVMALGTGLIGSRVPGGFLPEEDQGYIYAGLQLPDAASMERTAEVTKKAEEIMSKYEEIKYVSNITGYSFLISAARTNGAAFFVSLKPWEERKGEKKTAAGIIRSLNKEFAYKIPEAVVFASGPPAIPGLGTGSGFSMMLQDRGGNSPEYLHQKAREFIQAASKRPEIGGIFTTYGATTPQIFVDIDRERALKMGVAVQCKNMGSMHTTSSMTATSWCQISKTVSMCSSPRTSISSPHSPRMSSKKASNMPPARNIP